MQRSIIMDKKSILIVFLFFLLIFSTTAEAIQPVFNHIHYKVSGDGSSIRNIQLISNYRIDSINNFDLLFIYDGANINVGGSWLINFMRQNDFDFNIDLNLATNFNRSSLGKGIGFSIEGGSFGDAQIFAGASYFFDRNGKWIMEGGMYLPLISSGQLSLSLGNNYWQPSDYMLSIGLRMSR